MLEQAYAEFIAVSANLCIHIPDELSYEQAAGIPETWITATQALWKIGCFEPGQKVSFALKQFELRKLNTKFRFSSTPVLPVSEYPRSSSLSPTALLPSSSLPALAKKSTSAFPNSVPQPDSTTTRKTSLLRSSKRLMVKGLT